jgi:anion-transporting  ArsA/GET3 family ATPase
MTDTRVEVLLGAGGVGKTTCSIGLAMAAAQQGQRVALLSIDPAKRVAAALGIPLSGELKKIALPGLDKGSLSAAILDQKAVFDGMVARYAPTKDTYQQILGNRLYQAISARLGGSLEYMALAKLQELVEERAYDLIVLDTPPDTHALDFLARPNVLENFMENKVMSWLIKPFYLASRLGMGKLFSLGERLMGGIAKVTGMQSLHLIAEFLVLMQQVIAGFHRAGSAIKDTLAHPSTRFVFATTLTPAAGRATTNLARQLEKLGYKADQVIFNRCLPKKLRDEIADFIAKHGEMEIPRILVPIFRQFQQEQKQQARMVQQLGAHSLSSMLIEENRELGSIDELMKFSRQFVSSRVILHP